MPREAEAVHGLSAKFLSDKPLFAEIADEFAAFVKDAVLIIHNASFDMKFLNAELAKLGRDDLRDNQIIDTLAMARKKFPGAPASLDALCRRFGVDNSNRDLHGALIDSELLAGVYLELSGGRQPGLVFQADAAKPQDKSEAGAARGENRSLTAEAIHPKQPRRRRETPLAPRLTEAERAAHQSFLQALPQRALWLKDDA
jgi:DNA polymerase-3 subunit epsilon